MSANNKEKYAVLVEDHKDDKSKEEMRAIGVRPTRQLESKRVVKNGRSQRLPSCITWPLLLAISTACVALVTFHLWFTWHLQRKVDVLQTRVDALTTVDLQDLRAQLRNLYELYDTEIKDDDQQVRKHQKRKKKRVEGCIYYVTAVDLDSLD